MQCSRTANSEQGVITLPATKDGLRLYDDDNNDDDADYGNDDDDGDYDRGGDVSFFAEGGGGNPSITACGLQYNRAT